MALYKTREQRKWAARRRAELALKHAYERIDYLEDVVKPELQAMVEETVVLESDESDTVLELEEGGQ